jgi:hypothetical protein
MSGRMKKKTKAVLAFSAATVLVILAMTCPGGSNTSRRAAPLTATQQAAYEAALRATPTDEERARQRQAELLARAEARALLSTPAGQIRYHHRDWSPADCERIARGEVWVGMTMEQAETAWPSASSKTVTRRASGDHVQLCYGSFCESSLYYDNGRLTTIRKRN